MKCFGYVCLCFILCSCGNGYVSHDAVDNLHTSIDVLDASIPKECKTKSIELQIKGLKQQADTIKKDCDADIAKVKSDKVKWQTAFFGLFIIILVYVLRKVI